MLNILSFGLQPNQVETGMGGTILKLTESGHKIIIIDLATDDNTSTNQNYKNEAIKASRILGIEERITLDLTITTSDAENNQDTLVEMVNIYQNISPDIIFVPFPIETNIDSKKVAELCNTSLRMLDQKQDYHQRPKKTFYYLTDPLNYYQKPSFITDISKEIEMKVEALKCYESNFKNAHPENHLFENVLNLNRYYGMLIGKKFGESFISQKPLSIQNFEFLL